MTESNEEREARVFEAFLEAERSLDQGAKFENMKPPHPDILMSSPDGDIAFELVEIIDRAYARRLGQMFKTLIELPKYFGLQDAETQKLISQNYSDAMIFVDLRESLSLGQRRKVYGEIFKVLAETEFDGEGDFPLGEGLKDRVDRITIYRGRFEGPKFDTASAGYVGDPTISAISTKFGKRYEADSPIHLLAYIDSHPMLPDDVWLEGLVDFLDENSGEVPFEAIWVFDIRENKIKHELRKRNVT